jgi:hypothetical protein
MNKKFIATPLRGHVFLSKIPTQSRGYGTRRLRFGAANYLQLGGAGLIAACIAEGYTRFE